LFLHVIQSDYLQHYYNIEEDMQSAVRHAHSLGAQIRPAQGHVNSTHLCIFYFQPRPKFQPQQFKSYPNPTIPTVSVNNSVPNLCSPIQPVSIYLCSLSNCNWLLQQPILQPHLL